MPDSESAVANCTTFAVSISPAPETATNCAYISQNCQVESTSRGV
jgi:hypothetical protein